MGYGSSVPCGQIDNIAALFRYTVVAIGGPCLYELAALLDQITARICCLYLGVECMGQSCLGDFAGETGLLARPIAESRTEPMSGEIAAPHAAEKDKHCHVAKRLSAPGAGKM